jgi:ribosome maturation factor RimP
MSEPLDEVIEHELDQLGFELVEFRRGGTHGRPVLDVRIDRRDGEKVTIDDCARVSRALEARLDAGDIVASRYVLEVSSPGVERPLKRAADFRRFVGRKARVNSVLLGGRLEVELVGVESEAERGTDVVVVRSADGTEHRVPLGDVKDARLVFEWKKAERS